MRPVSVLPVLDASFLASASNDSLRRTVVLIHQDISYRHQYVKHSGSVYPLHFILHPSSFIFRFLIALAEAFHFEFTYGPRTFYNGVGFVKAFLATLPPPRAGRGVKGDPALCAGSFIEDP